MRCAMEAAGAAEKTQDEAKAAVSAKRAATVSERVAGREAARLVEEEAARKV